MRGREKCYSPRHLECRKKSFYRDIERRYTYGLFTSRQPVKSEANDAMTGIVSQVAIKKMENN